MDMPVVAASALPQGPAIPSKADLEGWNQELELAAAEKRVAWALARWPGEIVLSSSFGAQAAVSLHMVTTQQPDIPVILVDTGYLFPDTYAFIDRLAGELSLNLKVYRSKLSAAWQEARYGQLWTQGVDGIKRYNAINKVEPMNRALAELGARAWITGLRRKQSATRQHLNVLGLQDGRVKIHPIIDWSDRDVYQYLTAHRLPYHPLWEQGYISIGDVHTTHKITDEMDESAARFFGLVRECGIHQPADYSI
jgi:phosphoadenosine phosphosulfate reductase